jgi:ABC-type lipoprotein release transport system permease subunit
MAVAVLPLLYSLALFYRKRATEMAILRAMFAENRMIVKLFLRDIPTYFAACVLISLPLCLLSIRGAAVFCDRVLPDVFFAEIPIITSASPSLALFAVIVVSSLLSVISSVLVYCARATGGMEADEKNLYAE